jgi:hypothetical protein
MNAAVIAAAGITAVAVFFFIAEGDSLTEAHARVRTQILNTTRWAIVIALSWVLIPVAFSQPGSDRAATIVGLAALIGAVMLIPVRWFVRLGGRIQAWELRRAKVEMAQLANRIRRDRGSVPATRIRDAIVRIETMRTSETSELCGLMAAELSDLLAGTESWNEAGRRSIRIDALARRLWPDDMPPPDFDLNEATFRWHLYRTFGQMMELGALDPSGGSKCAFRKLRDSIEEFRRPDTSRFIDAAQQSADRWLASPAGRPWVASFDFEALGPDGLDEIRKIWGRDAAMWGADLDNDDRGAIKQDLARRAVSSAEASEPSNVPVGEAG